MQDEFLDIVDNNDKVIKIELRSAVYAHNIQHFRAVNAFIINDEGELWIPRRVATKKVFPLCLDTSVGGHVQSGETYDAAFERELCEETGIILKESNCQVKAYLTPFSHNLSCFMMVYEIKSNTTPDYNKEDFCEYYWIKPEDLIKKIEAGEPAKSDLIKMVKALYIS